MRLVREHDYTFLDWYKDKVFHKIKHRPIGVPEIVKWLAYRQKHYVNSYEGYNINGYSFYINPRMTRE